MVYTNECKVCGLKENEHRALADYNNPAPCTSCGGETSMVLNAKIIPFADGPNGGRMK